MTKNTFTIALAQINPTVGDIAGNSAQIMDYYEKVKAAGADLVVFPELSLIGYPPEDLVLMAHLREKAMAAAQELAGKTAGGPAMIIGSVWERRGQVYNAALLLDHGKIEHVQPKTMLPNYGVFDEKRLFSVGDGPMVVKWRGIKLGMLVCEDLWHASVPEALSHQGAQVIVILNASPFETGKLRQRHEIALSAVQRAKVPLVYVNAVGAQDDIVFDGGSFVMDAQGQVLLQMPEFEAMMSLFVMPEKPAASEKKLSDFSAQTHDDDLSRVWQAMVLGLRDYVRKNGFTSVLLGLSGGIDSAVSAAVAADALGAGNVMGVLLPSPYTSQESIDDALETGRLLGISTQMIAITPSMQTFEASLDPVFGESAWKKDVAIGGNLQSRLRGVTLMALSNKFGSLLMSTGNKSEIAVGYSTLYGDSCGAFNVLKDVYKTQVYALANWRNRKSLVIPLRSISKAPTAELAPGQLDQDNLPPYELLDAILHLHIEEQLALSEIVAKGYEQKVVEKVLKLVRVNEYKRRQSCPGVKVSSMMFGRDRRYPLTNKF